MLIDWFTVGAQMLNFVILVGLLKHFLYQPILDAIDARETRIAAELAAADSRRQEAEALGDALQIKERKFDAERAGLLAQAVAQAQADRVRSLAEARKDADDWRTAQQDALRLERARLGGELTRLVTGEVVDIARKTLGDLASSALEERIGGAFARRLQELDATQKQSLAAALESSPEPAVVRSRFALSTESRAGIEDALNRAFAAKVRIRFETAADGICGVELTVAGHKLAWSVEEYLDSLEHKLDTLLDAAAAPAPAAPDAKSAPPLSAAPPVAAAAAGTSAVPVA